MYSCPSGGTGERGDTGNNALSHKNMFSSVAKLCRQQLSGGCNLTTEHNELELTPQVTRSFNPHSGCCLRDEMFFSTLGWMDGWNI